MVKFKKNKSIKKLFVMLMAFMCFFSLCMPTYAASNWTDLGAGYRARWDPPHTGSDTGRYHVHVYEGNQEIGAGRCGGGKSHGDELNKVPRKVKDKVKGDKNWKKGGEKNKDLDKAAKKINSEGLLSKAGGIAIAIALVVGATATFFFPGDDVAAWANLLRAIAMA